MDQMKLTERAHNFEATVTCSVKLSARTVFSGTVSKLFELLTELGYFVHGSQKLFKSAIVSESH